MELLDRLKKYIDANTPRSTRSPVNPVDVMREGLVNPNKYNAPAANRFKDSVFGLFGGIPGVGDVASGVQAADYWNRGEKGAALLAGLGAFPLVPAFAGMVKQGGKSIDALSYVDKATKAKAGLLDDGVGGAKIGEMKNTNQAWAQTDVFGSGSRIDHVSQDGKSAVVQQMTRPGVYRYYPANVHEQFGVQPNMSKGFDSLEEAQRNIKGMRISDTRKANSQAKYGEIPNLWDGEAKRMAKTLIDNNIPIAKFSSSTQSKSKYIELADGRKIRLSDHDLPLSYEGADVDYRYGGNVKDIIKNLK
jgi:hypothetical protein